MTVKAQQSAGVLQVTVVITNSAAGHHVPTDHPGRHMILTVRAFDGQGDDLRQITGFQVPAWGGPEAGQPGQIYAKVLRDVESGVWPVVNYWKPTHILSDNRIPALGSDTSVIAFALAEPVQDITVLATLKFRRAPWALLSAKGWADQDFTMESVSETVAAAPWWGIDLPLILK
jgi:hypothetical protein